MARIDVRTISTLALAAALGVGSQTVGSPPKAADSSATAVSARLAPQSRSGSTGFRGMLSAHATLPAGHTTRYLLATVPDPDANAPRLYTDRVLDMMLLAAFGQGYFLLHHSIPWKFSLEPIDEEYAKRQEELKDLAAEAQDPGMLIFEKEKDLLIVFLVPESPTSGIRREPFERAFRYLAEKQAAVSIVGPTFTGSLHSLDELLTELGPHAADQPLVRVDRVISGTVLGIRPADLTWDDPNQSSYRFPRLAALGFEWLCRQQGQVRVALRDFLEGTRWHRQGMLDLAEDSTGFGQSSRDEGTITFPWQISRVRNAMPDLSVAKSNASTFALPLQLRDVRPAGSIPMFAPAQTPVDQELVLAQVISRVERAKQDYVYIKATDVLDAVFLSRLLRAATPTQRIVVMQPDLMFLRTDDQHPAAGLLTPSTFPLSSHLRFQGSTSIAYDSQLAAAVHRAATVAISRDRLLPPGNLWLETLGRSGYWPVAQLAPFSDRVPEDLLAEPPSFLWCGLFTLGAAALLLWFVWVMAAQHHTSDLAILPGWPGATDRARSLAVLQLVAGLALLSVAIPAWMPHQTGTAELIIYRAALAAVLACGAWLTWWLCGIAGPWRAVALLPLGVVAAAWIGQQSPDPYLVRQFFVVRSQDLLNGVNPGVPVAILLLGLLGCAWSHHQRTVIVTERSIDWGLLNARPTADLDRPTVSHWLLTIGFGAATMALGGVFLHSIEPIAYDWVVTVLTGTLVGWSVYSALSLRAVWTHVKQLLDRIELDDVRFQIVLTESEQKGVPVWEAQMRRRSFFFYARLREILVEVEAEWAANLAAQIKRFLTAAAERKTGEASSRMDLEAELAAATRQWEQIESLADREHQLRSRFLSLRLAQYLRAMFLVWRARLTAMSAGFIAVTLALNAYVFGPERLIQTLSLALLAGLGSVAVAVFLDMDRHPVLAQLSGSSPGGFNLSALSKILSLGALPALSLLASYTPALGRIINAYIQPALEVMAK